MGAAAQRRLDPALDPAFLLECLAARALARAYLWAAYEIDDLHDAVDPLWRWAEERGLVDHFGPNRIQAVLSAAFDPRRNDLHRGVA